MICGNPLQVEQELGLLEEGEIDLLHFDVMDGNFVPRLGLAPELVKAVRQKTELPIDVHLMVSDPERYIPVFAEAGADIIFVHFEASVHLPRLLKLIRRHGVRAGLALNPATSPDLIKYALDDIEIILLMTVNPGSVGEQLIPSAVSKIVDVHRTLGEQAAHIHILIDGNVKLDNAPEMIRSGATILVCGTSSIFNQGLSLRDSVRAFRRDLAARIVSSQK
jgi:ribulose-phosphate 3-epimerase